MGELGEIQRIRTILLTIFSMVWMGCDGLQLGTNTLTSSGTCRDYGSSYTEDGVRWTCLFDSSDNTLTCSSGTKVRKKKWESFADFLAETTMGIETYSNIVDERNETVVSNVYDSEGRILGKTDILEHKAFAYTDWDDSLRPTQGTYNLLGSTAGQYHCVNVQASFEYDSSAHTVTVTEDFSNSTGILPLSPPLACSGLPVSSIVKTYNSQGVRTQTTKSIDSSYSYTLHSMSRICDD